MLTLSFLLVQLQQTTETWHAQDVSWQHERWLMGIALAQGVHGNDYDVI